MSDLTPAVQTFGHGLGSRVAWLVGSSCHIAMLILVMTLWDVTKAEFVSECQTSYIEDASAPVDNIVDVAGRGDTVQTECH